MHDMRNFHFSLVFLWFPLFNSFKLNVKSFLIFILELLSLLKLLLCTSLVIEFIQMMQFHICPHRGRMTSGLLFAGNSASFTLVFYCNSLGRDRRFSHRALFVYHHTVTVSGLKYTNLHFKASMFKSSHLWLFLSDSSVPRMSLNNEQSQL